MNGDELKSHGSLPDHEADVLRDEVIRRMANTPPKAKAAPKPTDTKPDKN